MPSNLWDLRKENKMFKKKEIEKFEVGLKSSLDILTYLKNQTNLLQAQYDYIVKESGEYVTYVDTIKLGNIRAIFAFIDHLIKYIEGANAESIENKTENKGEK